jgi:hypothetical protein
VEKMTNLRRCSVDEPKDGWCPKCKTWRPSIKETGSCAYCFNHLYKNQFDTTCPVCNRVFDSTEEGKTRRAELYCSIDCADKDQPDMAKKRTFSLFHTDHLPEGST